jgi:hexose oxidase
MERRDFLKVGAAAAGLFSVAEAASAATAQLAAVASAAGSDPLVIVPGDTRFVGLTQGFNRRWNAPNCQVIYVPLTEAGAVTALGMALASFPYNTQIRGGGHCYENFVFNAGTKAIIDLSLLNQIGVDPSTGVFYAQAGATNWDLYRTLYWQYGVTLPAGSCYSVGLGGHICGGGYGLLSRLYGLTVDWLTGVNVVTVQGKTPALTHATSSANQDLFWAHTGGGGGNFGLVTRYEFATLPTAPQYAAIYTYAWNWEDINKSNLMPGILSWFQQLLGYGNNVFSILKLNHVAQGQVVALIQLSYSGVQGAESASFLGTLQSSLSETGLASYVVPVASEVIGHPGSLSAAATLSFQDLRWWEAVQTLNGSGSNQKGKYKSAYMRANFTTAQAAVLTTWLNTWPNGDTTVDMTQSLLQVDSYGGRINTVGSTETAVWQRNSIFKLQYQTYWQDPYEGTTGTEPQVQWIRGFYAAMYAGSGGIPDPNKDATVDGCYVNYPDVDLEAYGTGTGVRLYYGGNLPQLSKIKKIWDPNGHFTHAQSVPPATS